MKPIVGGAILAIVAVVALASAQDTGPPVPCRTGTDGGLQCELRDLVQINLPSGWSPRRSGEWDLEVEHKETGLVLTLRIVGGATTPETYVDEAIHEILVSNRTQGAIRHTEINDGGLLRTTLMWVAEKRIGLRNVWTLPHGALEREFILARTMDASGASPAELSPAAAAAMDAVTRRGDGMLMVPAFVEELRGATPASARRRLAETKSQTQWLVSHWVGMRVLLPRGWRRDEVFADGHRVLTLSNASGMPLFAIQDWRETTRKGPPADAIEHDFCDHKKKCRLLSRSSVDVGGLPAERLEFVYDSRPCVVYVFGGAGRAVYLDGNPELYPELPAILASVELIE
jgi:hypothetical protein